MSCDCVSVDYFEDVSDEDVLKNRHVNLYRYQQATKSQLCIETDLARTINYESW